MRSRRKKFSTLGLIAIVSGSVAWFAFKTHLLDQGAVLIAMGGTLLALLAVLGSALLENTGRIIPLLGLLICASLTGFGLSHQSTRTQVADQVKQWVDRLKPSSAPPAKPPTPPPVASKPAHIEEEKPIGSGTIFDMTSAGKGTAPVQTAPASPAPQSVTPPPSVIDPPRIIQSVPALTAMQRYSASSVAVTKARAKLDAATAGLLPSLSQTPAYQSAKSELDAADAALKSARANGDPGSAELVAAGQRYINAKTAVQKLINDAAQTDPATVSAKQELIRAQGDLQVAKEDLSSSTAPGKKK